MAERNHRQKLGTETSSIKVIRTLFLLLFLGGLIGGAIVCVIRASGSETDGVHAVKIAATLVAPPLGAFLFFIWLGRKQEGTGRFKGKLLVAIIGAGAIGTATWHLAPTRQSMTEELLEENRDFLIKRAGQFLAIKNELKNLPEETAILEGGFNGKVPALDGWAPKLSSYGFARLSDDFDTTFVEAGEFARLQLDTDPELIMGKWDLPDPELIGIGGRREYHFDSAVDELAASAFGEPPFYRPEDAQELIDFLRPLEQVIVVRMQPASLPQVSNDKEFLPGFLPGQAHLFDLESGELVGSFSFAATNTDRIRYTYKKNENAAAKDGSAMAALEKDLRNNGGLAFLHRIRQIAPAAVTGYEEKISKMPYQETALAAALLGAVEENRLAQENFDRAIQGLKEAKQRYSDPERAENPIQLDEETRTLLITILEDEGKIPAIREVRKLTGASLKDSKEYVESLPQKSGSQ